MHPQTDSSAACTLRRVRHKEFSLPLSRYCSIHILDYLLISTEIQTCNERVYVRADTKEGTEEWIRTLRKAAVSGQKLCD